MHHSLLGLVFNITVLILEYKHAAFAQTFSLGYKPIRPSYFYPDHPGHHPPQIIPQGWIWPSDPDADFTITSTTTTTVRTTSTQASAPVQIPNRRPDLPSQPIDERPPDSNNTVEINHWFRPVIITNTMSTSDKTDRSTTLEQVTPSSTIASTTSVWTQTSTTVSGRPPVQFLPEGDLFTSAPVRLKQAESTNSIAVSTSPSPPPSATTMSETTPDLIVESPEGNVTLAVADLLPLPIDVNKNGSAENLNLFLPALPLKAVNNNINE